jgi:hypothetical protein
VIPVKRHLRVVDPAASPPPRRRGPALALRLTDEEVRHFRAAVRGLARTRYASVAAIAREIGVNRNVLTRRSRPSGALVIAIWRLTGIPVDKLLGGKLAAVPSPGGAP